jgi:hypothetical protein
MGPCQSVNLSLSDGQQANKSSDVSKRRATRIVARTTLAAAQVVQSSRREPTTCLTDRQLD